MRHEAFAGMTGGTAATWARISCGFLDAMRDLHGVIVGEQPGDMMEASDLFLRLSDAYLECRDRHLRALIHGVEPTKTPMPT